MRHSNRTIVGLTFLLAGCPAVEPIDEDQTAGVPTEVQRVFTESCVGAGCHDSASALQGLSLEAGASGNILTATAQQVPLPLVDRGNVAGSYLAIKMLPEDFEGEVPRQGGIMPPPGQGYELSQEDLALVIGWIAGAPLPGGGDGETEGDTDTDTVDETDGEPMVLSCALEDIKPGAPNPIEAGTGVGEIPPDIADTLEINCGCHYAEAPFERPLSPYTDVFGDLDIATWEGFQETPTRGSCAGDLAYLCVQDRLDHAALPMPPRDCAVEDGSRITDEDFDLLNRWIDAGAPDGATWEP